ncbi:MAG TPA: transglycosylase SLT domain-containing protein [Methanosarcina sp.]|nr:transglycosylase SLT domain-containing protein [Methanosarcina sp.]
MDLSTIGNSLTAAQNLFGNVQSQTGNVSTAGTAIQTPPGQMGPTVAAQQGLQPTNPLNQPQPVLPGQVQPQGIQAPETQQAPVMPQVQPVVAPATAPQPQGMQPPAPGPVAPSNLPQIGGPAPAQQPQGAVAPGAVAPILPPPVQQTINIGPGNIAATPNPTYNAMLQVESGGRDYNPDGTPVTSKSGALFAGQVQPTTAADPGYGIKPAQSQTPEEYNRVGREYFDAMQRQFPGEPEKAIAAYNCGAANVHKAMAIANHQGGDWRQYLPQETQQYLQKVASTQAASAPVNNNVAGTPTIQQPAANAPTTNTQPQPLDVRAQQYHDQFVSGQNDIGAMAQLMNDPNAPDAVRKAASTQVYQLAMQQKQQQAAQDKINTMMQTGNTTDFARMLSSRTEEGSYIKAYLFHRFGLEDLAKNEQQKLGAGNAWQAAMGPAGQRAIINYDGNNMPIEGYAADGRKLTGDELATYGANAMNLKGAQVGTTTYWDPVGKQTLSKTDTVNGPIWYNKAGQRVIPQGEPVPNTAGTNLELQGQLLGQKNQYELQSLQNKLYTELQYIAPQEKTKYLANFNAQYGTNFALPGAPTAAPAQNVLQNIPGAPATSASQTNVPQAGVGAAPQAGPVSPQAIAPQAAPQVAPQAPTPVSPQAVAAPVPQAPQTLGTGATGAPQAAANIPIPAPQIQPGESPQQFKSRYDAWAEANKGIVGKEINKMYGAQNLYDVAKDINDILPKATGSTIGAKVDALAGVFGYSTEGAKATAQLQVLGNRILMNVPRFEGPQSDRDTAVYKQAAGDLSNPEAPIGQRIAAFHTIIDINKKYAPELNWDFGAQKQSNDLASMASAELARRKKGTR